MHTVRVRYFAGARAAAGVSEDQVQLDSRANVADVLSVLRERHGAHLTRVLTGCSFLLDGVAVRDPRTELPREAELDILPPFAGG